MVFSRWFARNDGCQSYFGLLSIKTFDSHFLDMMYLEFMKSFFSPIRANWWVLGSFRPPEPKNVWFPLSRHDVPRVHDTYHVLESFRPTEPKNVWFPLSGHDVRWVHKKFFFRWFAQTDWCYSHFGPLSLKTFDSHFLEMMYLEFMKSFFSPIRQNWWVLESFRPPEPKNVWFPLSRHDVRRVHKKFFYRWFARTDGC